MKKHWIKIGLILLCLVSIGGFLAYEYYVKSAKFQFAQAKYQHWQRIVARAEQAPTLMNILEKSSQSPLQLTLNGEASLHLPTLFGGAWEKEISAAQQAISSWQLNVEQELDLAPYLAKEKESWLQQSGKQLWKQLAREKFVQRQVPHPWYPQQQVTEIRLLFTDQDTVGIDMGILENKAYVAEVCLWLEKGQLLQQRVEITILGQQEEEGNWELRWLSSYQLEQVKHDLQLSRGSANIQWQSSTRYPITRSPEIEQSETTWKLSWHNLSPTILLEVNRWLGNDLSFLEEGWFEQAVEYLDDLALTDDFFLKKYALQGKWLQNWQADDESVLMNDQIQLRAVIPIPIIGGQTVQLTINIQGKMEWLDD